MRALCAEAGRSNVGRILMENLLNILYEITPGGVTLLTREEVAQHGSDTTQ